LVGCERNIFRLSRSSLAFLSIVEKEAVLVSESALERVRVIGPLAGFADGYRAHPVEQGYSRSGARDQFSLLVHASRWMEAEGLDLVALTSPAMLRRHFIWRREQGYGRGHAPMSLRGLVGYLNGFGVLTVDDAVRTEVDGRDTSTTRRWKPSKAIVP
jgi:hypothetical protein